MCIVHYIGGLKTACNNSLLGDALREAPGEGGWRDNVPITGCNSSQVQNICQRSCPLACNTQGKKKHSLRHNQSNLAYQEPSKLATKDKVCSRTAKQHSLMGPTMALDSSTLVPCSHQRHIVTVEGHGQATWQVSPAGPRRDTTCLQPAQAKRCWTFQANSCLEAVQTLQLVFLDTSTANCIHMDTTI